MENTYKMPTRWSGFSCSPPSGNAIGPQAALCSSKLKAGSVAMRDGEVTHDSPDILQDVRGDFS
jgi:hypothetical protein